MSIEAIERLDRISKQLEILTDMYYLANSGNPEVGIKYQAGKHRVPFKRDNIDIKEL